MNQKERVTDEGKDARRVGAFKKRRREFCVDTTVAAPSFRVRVDARVAELADAVDSKSTDESLVGSTPTPGTILIVEQNARDGNGTDSLF